MSEKKYPIGGYAPGSYTCKCCICGRQFQGDKRAVQCEVCAVKGLTPEMQLIYNIVEQWGNAIEMPNMERWLKDYAAKQHHVVTLPANDAVQNWFEENIDKDCSASSAIYKFRLWLEELQGKRPPSGPTWVKTSERLPGWNQPVKWRLDIGDGTNRKIALSEMNENGVKDILVWQWLDESPAEQSVAWVSADTKPEHNVGVLVFIPGEDNHITSGMWDISNEWVLLDEYRTPEEEVTHWMPLPAFPEGYTWSEIPNDLVDVLKKVAKEELAKRPKTAEQPGREVNITALLQWVSNEGWKPQDDGTWFNFRTRSTFSVYELAQHYKNHHPTMGAI